MPHRYDPNQPRVPAGHDDAGQWTDGAHAQQAFLPPPAIPIAAGLLRLLAAAVPLFARLSQSNSDDERAVMEINAREYHRDPDGAVKVEVLTRKEVKDVCKELDEVQKMANDSDSAVRRDEPGLTPTQHGTRVHKLVELKIKLSDDHPKLSAEVSRIKTEDAQAAAAAEARAKAKGKPDANADYGQKGSIRIDVVENVDDKTVCVYDLKTGKSGLSERRMLHLFEVIEKNPGKRVIVTEIRPHR